MTEPLSPSGDGSPSALGYAINAFGDVAGHIDNRAAVFSSGSSQDLGTLGGSASAAMAINSSGLVVGWSTLAGNQPSTAAFVYFPGSGMQNLGTLAGASAGLMPTWASDINDSGQIVGLASEAGTERIHGFLYSGNTLHDLDALSPNDNVFPSSINSWGDIVGSSGTLLGTTRPFIFLDGETHDIQTFLTASDAGWTIWSVEDINDSRQVVGQGMSPDGRICPILLSPVPIVDVQGSRRITTSQPTRLIRGKTRGNTVLVAYRIGGKGRYKPASGTSSWRFVGRLKPGRNMVSVIASGPFGSSAPAQLIVRRR